MSLDTTQVLLELADREAIRDVLYQYSHGIDRRDPELVRNVFWPEAHDDHGGFQGKAHDMVTWAMGLMETMSHTTHMLGNILIRINGATAETETYFCGPQVDHPADGPAYDMILFGRYIDRFEKRGNFWRIAAREVIYDWYRPFDGTSGWENGLAGMRALHGAAKPHDRTCTFLQTPPFGQGK